MSPLKYAGRLITDPKKTVGDTMSGIGTMVGRISSDIANIGKTPGDPISGLLGVTDPADGPLGRVSVVARESQAESPAGIPRT